MAELAAILICSVALAYRLIISVARARSWSTAASHSGLTGASSLLGGTTNATGGSVGYSVLGGGNGNTAGSGATGWGTIVGGT